MSYINESIILELAEKLETLKALGDIYQIFGQKASSKSNLNEAKLIISNVESFNSKASKKQTVLQGQHEAMTFSYRQLKVLKWVFAAYCCLHKLSLKQLKQEQFKDIQKTFPYKSISFLKYSVLDLTYRPNKAKTAKQWPKEELTIFTSLIESKQNPSKWKQISYEFFLVSKGKYFRQFQECREKWNNHLDPQVKKSKWTLQEDIYLISEAENTDCNWTHICQQMGKRRTQHQIKNRYNSLIKKYQKGTTEKSIRKIRAKTLRNLEQMLPKQEVEEESEDSLSVKEDKYQVNSVQMKPEKRPALIEYQETQKVESEQAFESNPFISASSRPFTYELTTENKNQVSEEDKFQTCMLEREDDYDRLNQEDLKDTKDTAEKQKQMLEIKPFKIPKNLYEASNSGFISNSRNSFELIEVESSENVLGWQDYFEEIAFSSCKPYDSFEQ